MKLLLQFFSNCEEFLINFHGTLEEWYNHYRKSYDSHLLIFLEAILTVLSNLEVEEEKLIDVFKQLFSGFDGILFKFFVKALMKKDSDVRYNKKWMELVCEMNGRQDLDGLYGHYRKMNLKTFVAYILSTKGSLEEDFIEALWETPFTKIVDALITSGLFDIEDVKRCFPGRFIFHDDHLVEDVIKNASWVIEYGLDFEQRQQICIQRTMECMAFFEQQMPNLEYEKLEETKKLLFSVYSPEDFSFSDNVRA